MYKVMLVDDEILVREAIGENIDWNALGFQLEKVCENGKEAIEYLQENEIDLVLTDIYMPYIDGMGLSKYIYENHPNIMTIILSGYGEFQYAKKAIQYKVEEYLLKPITPMELGKVLRNACDKLEKREKKEEKISRLEVKSQHYSKNASVIISDIISKLVQGTESIEKSISFLEERGISIEAEKYCVVLFDIDIYANCGNMSTEKKKESALMAFALENISNEILGMFQKGVAYRGNDQRVKLLIGSKRKNEFQKEIKEICDKIETSFIEIMKLSISVGVGKLVNDIEALHQSDETAMEMLKYRYVKGDQIYFNYEQEESLDEGIDIDKELRKIVELIKRNDANAAKEMVNEIAKEMEKKNITQNKAISYLHQMILAIYEVGKEIKGENIEDDNQKKNLESEITNTCHLEEGIVIVERYITKVIEEVKKIGQSSGERLSILALDYIKDNYSDKELGLHSICGYLNISTSHFSNVLKNETGETFMEILTKVRMEKAKELLIDTSLKNYEIADRIGFSDPHYFSIAFKKATGKTPKQYAKENR